VGGYLTGRLRTKWAGLHTHEVFFRDTAHGFVTWAVATVIAAGLFASVASAIVDSGAHAAAAVASTAATAPTGISTALQSAAPGSAGNAASSDRAGSGAAGSGPTTSGPASEAASVIAPYDIDTLFRSVRADSNAATADARAEAARILAKDVAAGAVPAGDRSYLAELVAARTGVSQEEAQRRVDNVIIEVTSAANKARAAADAARKAAATASIFTALSMLVGAFIACIAAALGGHRRDVHA
jgi:hypothetical protein